MHIKDLLLYFFVGGTFTALIVALEQSGLRLWSGFATLMPVFTLVSYLFIGSSNGGLAVSQHAMFVLVGTLVSWVPYMLTVAYLSPTMDPNKAIATGLLVFFIMAAVYLLVVEHYKLFQ